MAETGHQSCTLLIKATRPARLVWWALILGEFEIKFKSGKFNQNVDGFSRLAVPEASLNHESDVLFIDIISTTPALTFNEILLKIQRNMLDYLNILETELVFDPE